MDTIAGNAVISKDGTRIGYSVTGSGPALILIDGSLCYRDSGPARSFAKRLGERFTVYTYDRRGRGESGDTAPYAPEREVDDVRALIEAAGGPAYVFGQSSGAALALRAAKAGLPIRRLAVYEAPFIVDDTHAPNPADMAEQERDLVAAGRRGDAVKLFMRLVGVPAFGVTMMQLTPVFKKLSPSDRRTVAQVCKKLAAIAHTLEYDVRILGDNGSGRPLPADAYAQMRTPTLVMAGGKSPAYMQNSNRQVAERVPGARFELVPGQTHLLKADAVAPFLYAFLTEA